MVVRLGLGLEVKMVQLTGDLLVYSMAMLKVTDLG